MRGHLDFVTLDVFSFYHVVLFSIVVLLHFVVGNFLLPKDYGILTKSLFGISINSLLLNLLISVRMNLAHLYLMVFLPALLVFSLFCLIRNFDRKQVKTWVLSLLFLVLGTLVSAGVFSFQDRRLINAHWSYYFGLPAEILRGNYPSRIKIFDNFPTDYPNFHFFNSSQLALIMRPIEGLNFSDFRLAKVFILVLFLTVIFETLLINSSYRFQLLGFFVGIALAAFSIAPNVYWSINTTNYCSGFFLLMFLIAFIKANNNASLFWIAIFCTTSARSVLPGIVVWIYSSLLVHGKDSLSRNLWLKKFSKSSFIAILVILNILAMFFSGSRGEISTLSLIKNNVRIPYQNFVNLDWLNVALSSSLVGSGPSSLVGFDSLPRSNRFGWYFFTLLSLYALHKYASKSKKSLLFLVLILVVDCLISLNLSHFVKGPQILSLLENFLVPILMVLLLSNSVCRKIISAFILVSLFQLILLPPDLSIPNWALIEWLWLALFVRVLKSFSDQILISLGSTLILLISLGHSPIQIHEWLQPSASDSTTHALKYSSHERVGLAECESQDLFLLTSALLGNRVNAGEIESGRYSVTLGFVKFPDSKVQRGLCKPKTPGS